MERYSLTVTLFLLAVLGFSQPQFTDAPVISENEFVITVVESTEECESSPGVYQLEENGYSKIVDLEPLPSMEPQLAMQRNSAKVLDVLNTVGSEDFEVRDYREFWIDECTKQSQYVLSERRQSRYSALIGD